MIDLNEEIKRLQGEAAKLEKELLAAKMKLGNEKFVANAPEAVVGKEREKLANYKEKLASTNDRISQLQA